MSLQGLDVQAYPKLDDAQAGHIRHIRRLLFEQPDGDWSRMGTMEAGQEGLSSLRYQISHMFYALALAHFHRLPAAPAVFKDVMAAGIRKMFRRDVWGYWRDTSRSGPTVDPGIEELREPWGDPIVKENIMYSGQVHAMVGMFGVLFDDDRYERPSGISLRHSPLFVGEQENYEYDFSSLTDVIYWQMVENGWLGVACEPNCIFLFCNQFPILGFRFHDKRKGTSLAAEATESFLRAWQERDILTSDAELPMMLLQRQNVLVPSGPAYVASVCALMNAWNRDFVRFYYRDHVYRGLKFASDGAVSLYPVGMLPSNASDYEADHQQAVDEASTVWTTPDFGSILMALSEMGDEALPGMLEHADRYMNPTWERGALYYPRNDRSYDDKGNLTFMEPLTGNATIAYSRLNVPDGLWSFYNQPWDAEHFLEPSLEAFPGDEVDVLRAVYDSKLSALVLTLRPLADRLVTTPIVVTNPKQRPSTVYLDGTRLTEGVEVDPRDPGRIRVEFLLDAESDLVVVFEER